MKEETTSAFVMVVSSIISRLLIFMFAFLGDLGTIIKCSEISQVSLLPQFTCNNKPIRKYFCLDFDGHLP